MKYKPFTSKHCTPSRFTSPLNKAGFPTTDAVEKKTQMDQINAIVKANQQRIGYTPSSNRAQPTLDADRLNDPNYGKDSLFTKLKTIVSNPFDALTGIMGTNPDMQDLRQVRQLHEAKNRGDKDAKQVLARSSALNTASSFIPVAATADAIASTLEGDPTALVTKKLNKIKPAAKALKSINLDPTKTAKVLSTGIKVAKKI